MKKPYKKPKSGYDHLPKTKEACIARGLNPFDSERARAAGKVGGKSKSLKKIYALRLNALKRKGLTSEAMQRIVDLMEDKDSSALDILLYLEKAKSTKDLPIKERIQLIKVMTDWHKLKHGTNEAKVQIQMNTINLTVEEKDDIIKRMLK